MSQTIHRPTPVRVSSLRADAALLMSLTSPTSSSLNQSSNELEEKHTARAGDEYPDLPPLEMEDHTTHQSVHPTIHPLLSPVITPMNQVNDSSAFGPEPISRICSNSSTLSATDSVPRVIHRNNHILSINESVAHLVIQSSVVSPSDSNLTWHALSNALSRQTDRFYMSLSGAIFGRSSADGQPNSSPRIGMFAKKSFKVNEMIMIEDPVVTASCDISRCGHCSIDLSICQPINLPINHHSISPLATQSINRPTNRFAVQHSFVGCVRCKHELYCSTGCLIAACDNHQYECELNWPMKEIKQSIASSVNQSSNLRASQCDRTVVQPAEQSAFTIIDMLFIKLLSRSRNMKVFEANPWLLALWVNQSLSQSFNHALTQPNGNPQLWAKYLSLCAITGTDIDQLTYDLFVQIRSILEECAVALKTDNQLVERTAGFGGAIFETSSLIRRSSQLSSNSRGQESIASSAFKSNVIAVLRPDKYGNGLCLIAARDIQAHEELIL